MIIFQGRELCPNDYIKYMFNIGLCSDAHEPFPFKLGPVIHLITYTLKHLNDLDLDSRSQGYEKVGHLFCCKMA